MPCGVHHKEQEMQPISSIGQMPEQFSERDMAIVIQRAAGKTVPQIAVDLDCSVDTVYRRLRDPLVKAAITDLRGAELRPHLEMTSKQVHACIERLCEIRDNPKVAASSRVRAAGAIIELFLKLH